MNEAFFHRPETHHLVDGLRVLDNLTIYVGAGASIERTGLSWSALVAELLEPGLGDIRTRTLLTDALTPLSASSFVSEWYKANHPSAWLDRLSEAIRRLMYTGNEETNGIFNDRVAALVSSLFAMGRSVCIVTPNYDDLLKRNLIAAGVDVKTIILGRAKGTQGQQNLEAARAETKKVATNRSQVTLVYLHGVVPSSAATTQDAGCEDIYPVFSEEDYALTQIQSRVALNDLFAGRNILIVGSSLTDPPLINALLDTRDTTGNLSRYAIQPIQGMKPIAGDGQPSDSLVRLHKERAKHLDLSLVTPDFFIQAPQLLEEYRYALALGNESYSDPLSTSRYGFRLVDWWYQWFYDAVPLLKRQRDHHKYLERKLKLIRGALKASVAEPLKLEVWVRWHPESDRKLALWSSSSGTWTDLASMRFDNISADSEYVSVRAFTTGAPTFLESDEPKGRWKSYLALPIWYADSEENAQIPVGVVSLSSMWEASRTSLTPHGHPNSDAVVAMLQLIGANILTPTVYDD